MGRRWPADPSEGFDQCGALDPEVAAHGRFRHAAVQRANDGVQLLANNGGRSSSNPTTPLGGGQSGDDALSDQGALVLCERAEYVK